MVDLQRLRSLGAALIVCFLLAGCGTAGQVGSRQPFPTSRTADTARSSPSNQASQSDRFPTMRPLEVSRVCGWERKAYTWIDKNANGRPDPNEPPLPNVKIIAYFIGSSKPAQPADATNVDGSTSWNEILDGCPTYRIEVVAQPPQGYRLTTPERIVSAYPNGEDKQPFLFGFVKLP